MTFHRTAYRIHGLAPFGVFHNLGVTKEAIGYVFIHLFSRRFGITWDRT